MSKAIKFTDNNYLDSTSVVHNREKLSDILGRKDDTLPIGAIVNYDGTTVPEGYESVGNDYSTTEINTGQTWIDGKPIYRKIVEVKNLAIKDGTTYAHGIANVKEILPMSCGRMLYGNNTPFYTYPLVAHSGAILASTFNTTNIVWVGNDSWGKSHTHIFVIYYTKTTD